MKAVYAIVIVGLVAFAKSDIIRERDSCNPEEGRHIGYCQKYLRCDKETQQQVAEHCGQNLVWNPLNRNGTQQIHGGNCDTWDKLHSVVARKYKTDSECVGCFWRDMGKCSREYRYQVPGNTHRTVLTLSCAQGLVFVQSKKTCQRCQDVTDEDGKPCC